MTTLSYERLGSVLVALGATLLACYAVLFSFLPIGDGPFDYSRLVVSPHWKPITLVAFVGVVSILAGLDSVYSRMLPTVGVAGTIGLLVTRVALLLQACVLTWELLLDPIVAAYSDSAFLLRDGVIAATPAMTVFRSVFLGSILIGPLLLGLAVYRSNQFPKTGIVLIVVGAVVYAVGPSISVFAALCGIVLFAVGGLLISLRLWKKPVPC